MSEELTKLTQHTISHAIQKHFKTEKIVNYDLDFSRWNIKKLYKDTLWVQMIDDPDADTIMRNGISIPISQSKGLYRLGRILMAGPDVKHAQVGEYIRFSSGLGSPFEQKVGGYKTALIREEQVMMVVEFDGSEDEIKKNLEDNVYLQ